MPWDVHSIEYCKESCWLLRVAVLARLCVPMTNIQVSSAQAIMLVSASPVRGRGIDSQV